MNLYVERVEIILIRVCIRIRQINKCGFKQNLG